jgi:CBS domain-containing protein
MQARDVMRTDLVTARPDETVAELCDRLQEAHVHCAPVVRGDEELVGIVSVEDLLFGGVFGRLDASGENAPQSPRPALVRDIMTTPVLAARDDDPLEEVCALMWSYRVHHVPIQRDERLVGIVSSLDLARLIAGQLIPRTRGSASPGD